MPDVEILLTPGLKELVGRPATPEDIVTTLQPLDRNGVIRLAVRVLNGLALDRQAGYQDNQEVFIGALAPTLQAKYRTFARQAGVRVMFVHPAQQLALIHAAARYAMPSGGRGLGDPLARAEWALACLQINDHLTKASADEAGDRSWEKALYLFSEDALRWELVNPSRPERSLARLRALLTELPARKSVYAKSAEHLRRAFADNLGVDFETAFNLTAFLIFHWTPESAKLAQDPDAALINLETWLQRSVIPRQTLDQYLRAVALRVEDIPAAFTDGMSFRDVLPFRRKPLLRLDESGLAFLCPQFVSEKSWVDLFWLLTKPKGSGPEARMWTEDFGVLYEGYVRSVLEDLGPRQLGGTYVPDITYQNSKGAGGQIDGLIHAGNTLGIVEVKGSLVRQTLLAHGLLDEIRDDLTRKFIQDGNSRKGVSQLVHAIHWLADERRQDRAVFAIPSSVHGSTTSSRSDYGPPYGRKSDRLSSVGQRISKTWSTSLGSVAAHL